MAFVLAFALAALALWIAFKTLCEFRNGLAKFNFWWTSPKLEAVRADDSFGFWLIILSKFVVSAIMLFFASSLVRAA